MNCHLEKAFLGSYCVIGLSIYSQGLWGIWVKLSLWGLGFSKNIRLVSRYHTFFGDTCVANLISVSQLVWLFHC